MNVFADGAHEVADRMVVKLRARRVAQWLWVMPSGAYRIEGEFKKWRGDQPPDDCLVGLYKFSATHKQIREDIEERMKEIRQ